MRNYLKLIFLCALLSLPIRGWAGEILRLATTTSTYETGLLDRILPPFEQAHDCEVHVISVGTGKAMQIARNGDVDVILVHAREAEDAFVEAGYGVNRRDVMYNDFLLLGPVGDPAGVGGLNDAKLALKRIMAKGKLFVSRGDDSGTHQKERRLWKKAKREPTGAWYLEAGQGMSATLRMADEKNGYVMVDRATYLLNRDKIRLKPVVEGDPDLFNPYGIIPVSPYRYAHVKYELAMALVAWMTSPECQRLIAAYDWKGTPLFHPSAAGGNN
ncbi:MAG: substrate-binding domain-containing protein [Kiritimatiellia bacterium]|jgi:tungstate transport system substrate-binding protein|nr:substrate-binding domain-containing protein [Kiritimatiellia bacterium]MDP6630441.1 substrate-binding domain-containing protein [Kiritimatiellia bacterium]MDP6809898.1 substrate-binding domain-containing protein [Kiritimatiellia bacterium]MDP7024290.1 substrate-binding domain-containing protein [Kiritimatiellia bacterium]